MLFINGLKGEAMKIKEKRIFKSHELRVAADDNNAPQLIGYPAKFNKLSEDLGGFREKIAPGAFKNSIKKHDIRALFDHDSAYVLGRNKAGTLRLKEDDVGLEMVVDPPDTRWADDLMISINRGDINQMSFGFYTIKDSWDMSNKDDPIRTLDEVELFDVSVVTYPAYPDTEVALRSLDKIKKQDGAIAAKRDAIVQKAKETRGFISNLFKKTGVQSK